MAWAGAWTLPDGTGQWLTTLTAATSTSYLEGSAPLAATPRYDKDELSALIEYGVTDRLTAIVDPGLQHIDIAAPTSAERTGLGYTEFGARYAFLENQDQSWVLSGQATLRIPGTTDTSNLAAVGYTDVESRYPRAARPCVHPGWPAGVLRFGNRRAPAHRRLAERVPG